VIFLPIIIESGHSRFPVIDGSKDEVIGILHAKDVLRFTLEKQAEKFEFRDILRPTFFIPETKHLDTLLKEFQINQNHMAIVVDEYGNVSGCITIEDVLEQIVGEIEDEFDIDQADYIKKHNETEYTIKALTPIDEFNEYFKTQFSDEAFDTIGGLVMQQFGHVPKRGEVITIDHYRFKILLADKRQVRLLQLTYLASPL